MNHSLTLQQPEFETTNNLLLTRHDPLYATNDSITITLSGQREQKVKYIKAIHVAMVRQGYCYLELSDTRGVDDVSPVLGTNTSVLHEMINED